MQGPAQTSPAEPTKTRHKTQPKSFPLIMSTEFGQASQSRFCLQVFNVQGALGFTGCLRAASEASKTERISWGREGRALAAAGGQRGADFVLPEWGARAPTESLPHICCYLLHSSRCLQAPGRASSPTLWRGSSMHVSWASFSSQLQQKSCQMCQRARAQHRSRFQVRQGTGCASLCCSRPGAPSLQAPAGEDEAEHP